MKIKRQTDLKDCGSLVVQALHREYFEKWVPLNQIKMKTNYGTNGVNISNLIELASKYGIDAEAYESTLKQIAEQLPDIFLIGLINVKGMNHYVIFKYINKQFHIWDSIKGHYKLSFSKFENIFQGKFLIPEKGEYKSEPIDITHPLKYLSKNWNIISWIGITLIISIIFVFISSIFMKIVLDTILPSKLKNTLTILSLAFAFLAILKAFNKTFRSYLIKKLSLKIETDIMYKYIRVIHKGKIQDLSKITNNDNLRRVSMIQHISGFISNSFFVIFNEVLMLIISVSLLIWISPALFAISFASGGLIAVATISFRIFNRTRYDSLVANQLELFNSFVDNVSQISELKEPQQSKYQMKLFNRRFSKAKKTEYEIWSFNNVQSLVEMIIEFATPIALVYFGSGRIFRNQLTVGSLIMFLSIYNSFIHPIKDLCEFFMQLPQMLKNIELISFVANFKEEEINKNGLSINNLKTITLKDISIRYDKTLLDIKSFRISNNIHLKGKNGSGKSTLLKMISTRMNFKGELWFNKFKSEYYSLHSLRENIIYISPDTYIPNMSILEYVTQGSKESINMLLNNIRKYDFSKLLNSLELKLEMPLINNGQNISSGQRQIVTLLRLMAKPYKLVILDEAFENIDIRKMKLIKKAILKIQREALFIEVSHSEKYISKGKEVQIEKINTYIS